MPPALKYLTVEGQQIAYRDEGRGPALVFLHGLGGNSASWEPQFEAFADRYRLVAWDMPGFGSSDLLAASKASTCDYSLLVRKFMASLGIERAVGIGTSYGSIILADLAQTNRGLISALVFACGVTGMGARKPEERARSREVRRGEIKGLGQRAFAAARNSNYVAGGMSPALVTKVVELAASAQPEGYLQAYNALTNPIFSTRWTCSIYPRWLLPAPTTPLHRPPIANV